MKYELMLKILFELLSKKSVQASYLANKYEISVRSVYRYINCIDYAGIPIYTKRGNNGGFYILENLRKKTGIDFKPYCMDIEDLEKYRNYTKPFESNDVKKAESLIAARKYVDITTFMLNNKVKLEQEIISWMNPEISI